MSKLFSNRPLVYQLRDFYAGAAFDAQLMQEVAAAPLLISKLDNIPLSKADDIALGISKHKGHKNRKLASDILKTFSGHVDAKYYKQWDNYADFRSGHITLKELIDSNIANAKTIHFNRV